MKYLLLVLALTGCSTTVPVHYKFPEPPSNLALEHCAKLEKLETDTKLSDIAKTVNKNYQEYWTCSIKLDSWIDWYTRQKAISKELK